MTMWRPSTIPQPTRGDRLPHPYLDAFRVAEPDFPDLASAGFDHGIEVDHYGRAYCEADDGEFDPEVWEQQKDYVLFRGGRRGWREAWRTARRLLSRRTLH